MKIIDKLLGFDICKEIKEKEGMETGLYKMPIFIEKIGYSGLLITLLSFVCILFFGAYPFQTKPFLLGVVLLLTFFIGIAMMVFYYIVHKNIEGKAIDYLNERREKYGIELLHKFWF